MVSGNLQIKLVKGKLPQDITFIDMKKRKFKMKRKTNTITYISKHISTFEFRHDSPATQGPTQSGSVFFQCFVLFEKR